MPPAHLLPDRLAAVLAVVYLIFNEGYGGRGDLAAEAIRLGRALAELMPDEPEVHGLLALMLRERRPPRGALRGRRPSCSCGDQDRTLWDVDQIARGPRCPRPRAGARRPRALRAAGRDRRPARRGAAGLAAARRSLRRARPADRLAGRASSTVPPRSPRPATSRAPSRSSSGLELDRYHYLHATRAELLRRLDRVDDARAAYDRALELVQPTPSGSSSSSGSPSSPDGRRPRASYVRRYVRTACTRLLSAGVSGRLSFAKM